MYLISRYKYVITNLNFTISNIVLYLKKNKKMSRTNSTKLSLKFAPYLFIAVTILTTLTTNNGSWVWMNSNLTV